MRKLRAKKGDSSCSVVIVSKWSSRPAGLLLLERFKVVTEISDALANGGFVVAWQAHTNANTGVYFRMYDASGVPTDGTPTAGVLIDHNQSVAGLRDDVGLVDLRPRRAERAVDEIGREFVRANIRTRRADVERRLRALGERRRGAAADRIGRR